MRKRLILLLLSAVFVFAMTLTAGAYHITYVGDGEVAIGGVTLTSTEDYVQSIYGTPDDVSYANNAVWGNTHTARYGKSFFITYDSSGGIIDVKTTANNGLKTPSGFTVGQDISLVTNYFNPAALRKGDHFYACNGSWEQNMMFKYNRKHKISEISIYWTP
ncbi:hypothetical protein [uncultured Megasphaera sp.]|uniref:hypothetical protein n=1 Tax=uncultured Megasphaera sp. TaxID=165188 RepID=UPI0025EA06DB|nr:hypothetical protein [uncultured Megasphaera sp.]